MHGFRSVCTGTLPEASLVLQGLEDITVIGSASNVVNVNVSVSLMRPHSAVQMIANVSDLRPTAAAVQQTGVT